jgi:hypothetical protein
MKALKTMAAVGAVAALAAPSLAATEDVWKVNGHVDGKDFVVTCHFDPHGGALGGACFDSGTDLRHPLMSGAMSGDQVKWTYQSHWGLIKFDVLYTGKLAGAAMHGTVSAAGHNGTFTAAKQ